MDDYLEANRRLWDAWTPLNVASEFYDVEGFKAGRVDRPSMLHELEANLVGDVTGRSLLHLQSHFGMDTIRWAKHGATVIVNDLGGSVKGEGSGRDADLTVGIIEDRGLGKAVSNDADVSIARSD